MSVKEQHEAAKNGDLNTVRALLASGVKVNEREARYSWNALFWATRFGHVHVVKALLAANTEVDAKSKSRKSALRLACRFHKMQIAKILLAAGAAEIKEKCTTGWTTFHLSNRDVSVMREMLVLGANINELGNG